MSEKPICAECRSPLRNVRSLRGRPIFVDCVCGAEKARTNFELLMELNDAEIRGRHMLRHQIAALPDLIEACEAVCEWSKIGGLRCVLPPATRPNRGFDLDFDAAMTQVEAALAKAKGQEKEE